LTVRTVGVRRDVTTRTSRDVVTFRFAFIVTSPA
jgi:hypothetical protein